MSNKTSKNSVNMESLAVEIDSCIDNEDVEQLLRLILECQNQAEKAVSSERVELYYFEGNIHAALRKINSKNKSYLWSLEQPEAIAEILALRKVIKETAFEDVHVVRRCQILTNLGNCLNNLGRVIEAIEQWDTALNYIPKFAKASGARGMGLTYYAECLYDQGHVNFILAKAYQSFAKVLQKDSVWDSGYCPKTAKIYEERMQDIKNANEINERLNTNDVDDWSLGDCKAEIEYRKWCLSNRLFLNPLNDVSDQPIAAQDIFHLPDHIYSIKEEPRFVRFYDTLKQEFVASRALYFESVNADHVTFQDRGVLLFDHFDGSLYGLKYEKLKLSFRAAYSLFDKIAVFINDYLGLGKKSNKVNFRNVWYKDMPRQDDNYIGKLEDKLLERNNFSFKALLFLSKDIFDPKFQHEALPDSAELYKIRHAAEHRFLSVHEYENKIASATSENHQRITLDDLENKTLRILKTARAALIYLSLAIKREEYLRSQAKDQKYVLHFQGTPLSR